MRHPATQALYAYWNEVRGNRRAPRRLEIQPARIGTLLLDTFILECADRATFRFRLAGTRVCARFGTNLRAANFLECWSEGDRSLLEAHLSDITSLGRAGVFTGEAGIAEATEIGTDASPLVQRQFELLVLPLVHTGHAIDRLLCQLVPLEEAPEREAPLSRMRLLAAEAVWPDGPPKVADPYSDRQLPLHPQVRMARIVRQGRRQFRVYQGGLVDAGQEKR